MSQLIRVLVYEDVPQLRESLVLLLSHTGDFEVLGSFDNCESVDEDVRALQPDVILMDIDMPGMSGIEGVKKVRKQNHQVKILMLTVFDDNRNVFEALKAGANGYLLKKTPPDRLVEHVREAFAGGGPMTASIATEVLKMFNSLSGPVTHDYHLSEREKQVLQLLVEGNSYKIVAAQMFISIDTVRSHIRSIYEKLHVNSKSEAVAKALKDRIV